MKDRMIRAGVLMVSLIFFLQMPGAVIRAAEASVSAVPSALIVAPGDEFDIPITVNTDSSTRIMDFSLSWDPDKVECISFEQGDFYTSFAEDNNGSVLMVPSSPAADNTSGNFPASNKVAFTIADCYDISNNALGPVGTGNVFILRMQAKSDASGVATFTLSAKLKGLSYSTTLYEGESTSQITIEEATTTEPPEISGFNPVTGGTGELITITGTNFTQVQSVKFGGTAAATFSVASDTQITATVGSGTSGKITVTTMGGTAESTEDFTFISAPKITGFSPTSAGQDMEVVITGTNLDNATAVCFGGTAAQSITVDSSTQITAIIADGSTGKISVTTPGGTAESTGTFTLVESPVIDDFSPRSAGSGMTVTITGSNLANATVKFGGTAALGTGENTESQVIATVGSGSSGTISVTTPGGTAESDDEFTFDSTALYIDSFDPAIAGEGDSVVISGSNFTSDCTVQFGDTDAESVTVDSETQITAVVGDGSSGSVSVTNSTGTISLAGFDFAPTPTISDFDPEEGDTGDTITITGTDFVGDDIEVTFGDVTAESVTVDSETQITAVVGDGASGDVTVTTVGGTDSQSGFTFTGDTTTTTTTTSTTSSTTTTAATATTTTTTTTPATTTTTQAVNSTGTTTTAGSGIRTAQTTKTSRVTTASSSNQFQPTGDSANLSLIDVIDTSGVIQQDTQFRDIRLSTFSTISLLSLPKGTRMLTADGQPLDTIYVVPATMPTSAPQGSSIINSFEFEPSGATFSRPFNITFRYEPSQIPEGFKEQNLALACYDTDDGKWKNCDFILNNDSNEITAQISHFSLYSILASGSGALAGIGWNTTAIIMLAEIFIGGGAIYYFFIYRRRQTATVPAAAAAVTVPSPEIVKPQTQSSTQPGVSENASIAWDEILPGNLKKGASFKTQIEITGGKITIPQNNGALPLEIVNTVDTHLLVSLEYDTELYPQGKAKIIVFNAEQYEKAKEFKSEKGHR